MITLFLQITAPAAGQVSGELRTWHKVTITFDGPQTSETAEPNPFTDYRLDVAFSQGGKRYVVYLPNGGTTDLDLGSSASTYRVWWYNPRTGGALLDGSVTSIAGPGVKSVGQPPSDVQEDRTVLIRPTATASLGN